MEIRNASDAKREFGELQFLKEQWLKSELQKGFDDLQAGRIKNGQDVMDRQRKRITNASL